MINHNFPFDGAKTPNDFPDFCKIVYNASATQMCYEAFITFYGDILQTLFWNPDIDQPLAIGGDHGAQLLSAVAHKHKYDNHLFNALSEADLSVMQDRLNLERN